MTHKPFMITPAVRKWPVLVELALFMAIFAADWAGYIPLSKTPVLFLLAWVALRARRLGWRDVGLAIPQRPVTIAMIGIALGIMLEVFQLAVTGPVLTWAFGREPDLSEFAALRGNLLNTAAIIALSWVLAACGEELVYRGYLLNRLADVTGRSRIGCMMSVLLSSVIFGLAHSYQDITGIVEEGIAGAALAAIYLGFGRNLWAPIFAHGAQNTVAFVLIYLGRYPGVPGGV